MAADDRSDQGALLEDNKARVRRYVEEFQSAGNVETADALVAADIIHHHGPGWTLADTTGRDGAKAFIAMLRAAFPDLHAVIHDQLAQGDKVMTRKSFSGTHRGTFWGIPPTGKQVTIDLIDILRITDDQMVEHWNLVDWMGLMQQLQTTPPTGTTRRMTRRQDTPTSNPPKRATRRLSRRGGPSSTCDSLYLS